jgi:hypothetical protein
MTLYTLPVNLINEHYTRYLSISSMNTIQGADALALSNKSRTAFAESPWYLDTMSDDDIATFSQAQRVWVQ